MFANPLRGFEGKTLLYLAVSWSEETVVLLLLKGVTISAGGLEGTTALHLAAQDSHKELIDLLINKGAETAVRDELGRIPLHCCAELGYGEATKLLVDRQLHFRHLYIFRFIG